MARYFSFLLLLVVIGILAVLLYKVMAIFLVPLFLAVLLVVIFRPVHVWFSRFVKRPRISALLTTASILLLVLVPLSLLFVLAANEGRTAARRFSSETLLTGAMKLRDSLQWTLPEVNELRALENHLDRLSILLETGEAELLKKEVDLTVAAANRFGARVELPLQAEKPTTSSATAMFRLPNKSELWSHFLYDLNQVDQWMRTLTEKQPATRHPSDSPTDSSGNPGTRTAPPAIDAMETRSSSSDEVHSLDQKCRDAIRAFDEFSEAYCGGKSWSWLKRLANPTREEINEYSKQLRELVGKQLVNVGGATTVLIGRTVFGLFIMIISLYFFLLDGPKMIAAMQRLSPLDDEHERELIEEFERVSRAVVVATLLAALVQGLLAGIGFFFAGLDNVFLLTLLTVCFAMVPFFGAAAVWLPCCIWIAFIENRIGAAIGLGLYGTLIVSLADNLIKPLVLHGQSNIHPLVALLSILGGVAALGPIGILIGPMVVAFLQTLLRILQRELVEMGQEPRSTSPIAASPAAAIPAGTIPAGTPPVAIPAKHQNKTK